MNNFRVPAQFLDGFQLRHAHENATLVVVFSVAVNFEEGCQAVVEEIIVVVDKIYLQTGWLQEVATLIIKGGGRYRQ